MHEFCRLHALDSFTFIASLAACMARLGASTASKSCSICSSPSDRGSSRRHIILHSNRNYQCPSESQWPSAQVLSESLIWMAKAIEDFGLAVFNVGQLIEWGKVS